MLQGRSFKFGTGDVHESNAMPDGMFVLRDVGPYLSSTYLEGLCIVREWYMYPPYMYLWEGNVAAVAGTMANGDGYRHYLRFHGWCNVPWMSKLSFKRLKIAWGEGLLRESAKSHWQKQEGEIAEERSSNIDVKAKAPRCVAHY